MHSDGNDPLGFFELMRMSSADIVRTAEMFERLAEACHSIAYIKEGRENASATRIAQFNERRAAIDQAAKELAAGRLVDMSGLPPEFFDALSARQRKLVKQGRADQRARRAIAMIKKNKSRKEIAGALGLKHKKSVARIVREYQARLDDRIIDQTAMTALTRKGNV